jgi:hypothetical protein
LTIPESDDRRRREHDEQMDKERKLREQRQEAYRNAMRLRDEAHGHRIRSLFKQPSFAQPGDYTWMERHEIEVMEVPGGWLARTTSDEGAVALCFIPRLPAASKPARTRKKGD